MLPQTVHLCFLGMTAAWTLYPHWDNKTAGWLRDWQGRQTVYNSTEAKLCSLCEDKDLVTVRDWNSLGLRSEGQLYLSKPPQGVWGDPGQLHPLSCRQRRCRSQSEGSSFQPIIAYLVCKWDVLSLVRRTEESVFSHFANTSTIVM